VTSRRKRRLPALAGACLAGALAGVAAAWALSGFGPPAGVDQRLAACFGAAGLLLPLGLSVFNVFWKETLYQNLPMAGALVFGLCFDLVFVTALALGVAWASGLGVDPAEVIAWCAQPYVLCGLILAAMAWFLWHFVQMVRLILGRGQLGRFLTGRRKYPVLLERFVLVVEMEDPPSEILETAAPRYLSYLNDFYQEVETIAQALGGETIGYTPRGIQLAWPETKGGSNNHPLYSIFELRRRIREDRDWYQVVYRTVPHFRTALHFGTVTSAEMGWRSRHIRTQGEAVEIAGRLAQSCHKLKENFLVSEPAMDRLVLPAGSRIHRSVAAQIPGGETNMRLYALEQIEK
jgi:hypothetical protein